VPHEISNRCNTFSSLEQIFKTSGVLCKHTNGEQASLALTPYWPSW